MKIAIIGNCQVAPLAEIISAGSPGIETKAYEVWQMKPEDFSRTAAGLGQYDAVVSQPLLSDHYGNLSTRSLKQICGDLSKPLHIIHNIYISSVVPDCTYVGRIGKRVRGPLSDYHSRIVLKAFLEGLDEKKCVERLECGYGIDLQALWKSDIDEFRRREADVDVPYLDEVVEAVGSRKSFHYFNHPTAEILEGYAAKIAERVTGKTIQPFATGIPDRLAVHGSWPTYGWVTRALGLKYENNFFTGASGRGSMDIEQFIAMSFDTYGNAPRDNLI